MSVAGVLRNRVKRVVDAGGIALGASVGNFAGPTMPELIGLAGYDAAVIDLEHGGFDLQQVLVLILACENADITPIVRVPSLDPALITRLLGLGAQGIQLSGVSSTEEARRVVAATRFPPAGSRGLIGNSRSLRYGGVSPATYLEQVDREILIKVTIEDRDGLEAVEEIAAVDGIDLIGIGPHDLSAALGVVGEPDSPVMAAAIERVARAAQATGQRKLSMSTGHPAYPRTTAQLVELGVAFVPCQPLPERRLLDSMTQQVRQIRADFAGGQGASP